MAIALGGFVRLRKHQLGRQADFGTAVAATRAYPFQGTPDVNLNWTDPTVDVGSLDPVAVPYRARPDLTQTLTTDSLAYNDLPLIFAAFFGGEETPTGGGTAKHWAWAPASATVDARDVFTEEFGDDVTTDWFQLRDGIAESFELTGPEGLGPLTASLTMRYGAVFSSGSTDSPDSPTVPTAALTVATDDAIVYLKDGSLYIADSFATLFDPGSKISDALHTFTLRGNQEMDLKAFANGTQTFDLAAYGPGARNIEFEATYAKSADIVGIGSESDKWMSDLAVNRFVGMKFISKVLAQTASTYYELDFGMPLRYYTRADGESGGNTTVTLNGHAYYDGTRVFTATVVNTLTDALLGTIGT